MSEVNVLPDADNEQLFMSRKLLFVVNVDWFFLSHRLPIALEAMRQGYEVHIATGLTDKIDELQRYGLLVHPLELDRSSVGLVSTWRTILQLRKIFKNVQPDVVHLVTIKPVLLGGMVARLSGLPAVVVAVSGLGFVFVAKGVKASVRRWLVGGLYKLALGHNNLRVIFQNSDDQTSLQRLSHLPDRKVAMIRGSGVDLTQYNVLPIPVGVPVVLLASRLLVDKGVREFVQSAQILRQRGLSAQDVRFVIVGKPDLDNPSSLRLDELESWAEEGVVELWGHRTDMPQVMRAASIVVLPSYYGEGLPKVLIEAAACGRVVITTDHPGCRDAIDPDITGILVPLRDSMSLANVIEELLIDPDKCANMGRAGRELAESQFDVRQVVTAHLQIYQKLIVKKKKVLFVVNSVTFFLSHRLPIAHQLIEDGFEVHLAASGETLPILDAMGLIFHDLRFTRQGTRPLSEIMVIWHLFKLFNDLKPDIVHLVTIKPYLYGGIAAKLAKVPAVVSAVSGLGVVFIAKGLKAKLLRAVLYPLYKLAFSHSNQSIIFQNRDDAEFLVNWVDIPSSKVCLIRSSGVDLNVYQNSAEPTGKITVAFVARLLVDKGIREFINASKILHSNGKEVIFLIAGDLDEGNPASIDKEEVASWKRLPNVTVIGFSKDIAGLYSQSHIACLPSYREGLPKSLIEAAACGKVVITTDVPGCRDAIEPDKTGILVPIKNAKAIADAIEYLIENPDERQEMGAAGRAFSEKEFGIKKIVAEHMELYSKLTNKLELK
jgi:glycosyltransferase involved in cell wall biosynthesis